MGNASPLVPTYASAEASFASSAAAHAPACNAATVSWSSPDCTATSSARPAAAMSSRRSRFTGSVGRRQGLRALQRQHPTVDGQGARAGTGAEQFEAELLVGVALAEHRTFAQGVVEGGAGRLLPVLEHRRAAAAELDLGRGRADDHDLCVADGAVELLARAQFHDTDV